MVKIKAKANILLSTVIVLTLLFGVILFEIQGFSETLEFTKKAKEKEKCMIMVDIMRDYADKNKEAKSIQFVFDEGTGEVVIKKEYPYLYKFQLKLATDNYSRFYTEYYQK